MIPNDVPPTTELVMQTPEAGLATEAAGTESETNGRDARSPEEAANRENRRDACSTQKNKRARTYTASEKSIASNRKNARRSTGPRTAEGKAVTRMNAVKHGILSGAVVVRGLRIQEQEGEFKELREQCWQCLAPVGRIEMMLVDRIVTAQWRLRRALMAETGEIVLSVDGGLRRRSNREPLPLGIFMDKRRDAAEQMEMSTQGLGYLKAVVRSVREDVERDGELTQATCDQLLRRFINEPNSLTRAFLGYRERFMANASAVAPGASSFAKPSADKMADKDALSPEELKENHQRAVLSYIEMKLADYEELSGLCEEREDKEDTARQAANVLPSAAVLDKILRYEGALDRQLYRAMNQLERLQRRREGEDVPPPGDDAVGAGVNGLENMCFCETNPNYLSQRIRDK